MKLHCWFIIKKVIELLSDETQLLSVLYSYKGEYLSERFLSEYLNVSPEVVKKYAENLKNEGYSVESSPDYGFRLNSYKNILTKKEVSKGLQTRQFGRKLLHFFEVTSTNRIAHQIASQFEGTHGTVVVAESQTGGKGRMGRRWFSPRGGLWFSLILQPTISPSNVHRLTHIAGIAVAKTIQRYGINARIKWPNDVLIRGKKVCGILTEVNTKPDSVVNVVIGIGINANINISTLPDELQNGAISLMEELGERIDRTHLFRETLLELEETYRRFEKDAPHIMDEWKNLSDTIGREVIIQSPSERIEGKAIGISASGALIVRTHNATIKRVFAGDCLYTEVH